MLFSEMEKTKWDGQTNYDEEHAVCEYCSYKYKISEVPEGELYYVFDGTERCVICSDCWDNEEEREEYEEQIRISQGGDYD